MNGATVKVYSRTKDGLKALSANFHVNEFACQDSSDTIFVSSELVEVLQKIRSHFGKAVVINSAYRTEQHNKKVGGTSTVPRLISWCGMWPRLRWRSMRRLCFRRRAELACIAGLPTWMSGPAAAAGIPPAAERWQ